MLNFIKKYIFYQVDADTKKLIRTKVKTADHRGFQVAVLLITFFQIFMLALNFIRKGWEWTGYVVPYRILYIGLAAASILFCILLRIMYRKDTPTGPFFAVVIIYLYIVLAWGIGISVLDSYKSPVIITFAYVTVTLAAFITIEPWGYIGAAALATLALNICLIILPNATWTSSALINSISVFILASMVSVFTFYRRINSFMLEIEVQELNNELESKAYMDDLTKLYNRRYLSESMEEPLDYSKEGSGIILMDIDNFKSVNDTYGHLSGDAVLKTVGAITLNQDFYSYCVRYGGEEIMLFFQSISNEGLYTIAEKLRMDIEQEKIKIENDMELSVTVSIGIAKAKSNISYNQMIDLADEALYKAKKNGKNQTIWAIQEEIKEAE